MNYCEILGTGLSSNQTVFIFKDHKSKTLVSCDSIMRVDVVGHNFDTPHRILVALHHLNSIFHLFCRSCFRHSSKETVVGCWTELFAWNRAWCRSISQCSRRYIEEF